MRVISPYINKLLYIFLYKYYKFALNIIYIIYIYIFLYFNIYIKINNINYRNISIARLFYFIILKPKLRTCQISTN